jgi:transposase InsO family protein
MGIRDRPTAPRSPWQNGHVERLIGSIRRECLDHVVILGEAHLRRILTTYASYYNDRELIDLWPRTPRSIASSSSLALLRRDRSSAAFTINIAESDNRYTQDASVSRQPNGFRYQSLVS